MDRAVIILFINITTPMAMQGGLIQDQNNIPYNGTLSGGKINIHNAQKKITGISKSKNSKTLLKSSQSIVSVRKILGDVTNSKKPPQSHQASKKVPECKMDSIIMDTGENEGIGEPSKSLSSMKSKKTVQQTMVRKALGDRTNSQIPSSIENEGFIHNHDECIKARKRAEMIDLDYFMEFTIGQDKSTKLVSPPLFSFSKSYENDDDDDLLSHLKEWTVPESPKSQPKSTKFMELEEDDGILDSQWMESCDFKLKD